MTRSLRSTLAAVAAVVWCAAAAAAQSPTTQSTSSPTSQSTSSGAATPSDTRPATPTFTGDTGLWFVPTADVLARGKWSVSGYRASFNYQPGFANVGLFGGTFAVGLADRFELFGSLEADKRIDRDLRPIFVSDPRVGGVLANAPFMSTT